HESQLLRRCVRDVEPGEGTCRQVSWEIGDRDLRCPRPRVKDSGDHARIPKTLERCNRRRSTRTLVPAPPGWCHPRSRVRGINDAGAGSTMLVCPLRWLVSPEVVEIRNDVAAEGGVEKRMAIAHLPPVIAGQARSWGRRRWPRGGWTSPRSWASSWPRSKPTFCARGGGYWRRRGWGRGSSFPSLLEPRRRGERALAAVVQEAYVHGVSTRKVDELMKALGLDGISKSEVSRVCAALDVEVEAFRSRRLEGEYPYVWLDATYHKVRHDGRVISMATVAAIGVTADGERQGLGVDAGPAEDGAFWTAFLRGLGPVGLVIFYAPEGLKRAVATVLTGASWQRCRVHFMRNLLARVPKAAREAVAAVVRTIFAQPDHASALAQLRRVVDGVRRRFPDAAALLEDAAEDILAYLHFPKAHRARLHSTNPLERLNKEIKRRSNVVGIFPNRAALLRLGGAVLAEQDDEWAVAERRYYSAESMRTLTEPAGGELAQELIAVVA